MSPLTENLKELYTKDYYSWTVENARILSEGKISEIDSTNLAEEVRDLGEERYNKLTGHLSRVMEHIFKIERYGSIGNLSDNRGCWLDSAENHIDEAENVLAKNPGLKSRLSEAVTDAWRTGRGHLFDFIADYNSRNSRVNHLKSRDIPKESPWTSYEEIVRHTRTLKAEIEKPNRSRGLGL